MNRRVITIAAMCLLANLAGVRPAWAQHNLAIRGGVGADPTQVFGGVQIESPRLDTAQHVSVRPSVELGFGSNSTLLVTGNLEILYYLPFPNSKWSVYIAIGPTVDFAHGNDESGVHGKATGAIGFAHPRGFFGELGISGGGGTTLKATVGYVLRKK